MLTKQPCSKVVHIGIQHPLVSLIKMLKFWMLLMLTLCYYFKFNTKSERWMMWLFWKMCKMFKMFVSQGQSGSHLLKKLGRGLPDSGWSVSGSACCTSHLCGTSSGWFLQNNCSWWFPWSVHWSGSCGYSWWFGCCWSNWCSVWGCCHWSHWEQPRWGLWCSWGYICAGQHSSLDSIWVAFTDVVTCMSVLASPNDLNQVWAIVSSMNDCGWEPEGLGIIEYRDSLSCI